MDIEPTFKGYIEDENDALLILQATLDGKLKHIPRRPYEIERPYLIVSGNIFVFIEEISGIKRWTDGVSWSPSRIANKFLIYKEVDKDNSSSIGKRKTSSRIKLPPLVKSSTNQDSSESNSNSKSDSSSPSASSLRSVHPLKYTGLVKKTISVSLKRPPYNYYENFHIVSYYTTEDVKQHRLITPKDSLFFRNVRPSHELITAMENTTLGNTKGHNKNASLTPSGTPMGNMEMVNINTAGGNPAHVNPYNHQGMDGVAMNSNMNNSGNGRNGFVKNEDYSSNSSSSVVHSMNPYVPQSPNPQSNRYYVAQNGMPNGTGQVVNGTYGYQTAASYVNSDYMSQQPQGQTPQTNAAQQFQQQNHPQKAQQTQPVQHQANMPGVTSYPYYYSATPMNNHGYSESNNGGANGNTIPASYYGQNEATPVNSAGIPNSSSVNNISSITYNPGPYPVYPVNVNMQYYGGNSAYGKAPPANPSGQANENSNPGTIPTPINGVAKANSSTPSNTMNSGTYNGMPVTQGQMSSQQNHTMTQQPQYVPSQQVSYSGNNAAYPGYANSSHNQSVAPVYQYQSQSMAQYPHQVVGAGPNVAYMYPNLPYQNTVMANGGSQEVVNPSPNMNNGAPPGNNGAGHMSGSAINQGSNVAMNAPGNTMDNNGANGSAAATNHNHGPR